MSSVSSFRFASTFGLLALAAFAAPAAVEPVKTKALSTQVNVLSFDVYDQVNGAVGGKMWLSENRALYTSFDAGFYRQESERGLTSRTTDWHVGTGVGLEQHAGMMGGLSPYLFGGVFIAYERSHSFYSGAWDDKDWGVVAGLDGGAGLEYWVMPRLSVGLRQNLRASYRWGRHEDEDGEKDATHSFRVGLGNSGLILSLYF